MFEYDIQFIEKTKVPVEVIIANGLKKTGFFYVGKNQRVVDMINENRDFIPFEAADGSLHLINKHRIVDIEPALVGVKRRPVGEEAAMAA